MNPSCTLLRKTKLQEFEILWINCVHVSFEQPWLLFLWCKTQVTKFTVKMKMPSIFGKWFWNTLCLFNEFLHHSQTHIVFNLDTTNKESKIDISCTRWEPAQAREITLYTCIFWLCIFALSDVSNVNPSHTCIRIFI